MNNNNTTENLSQEEKLARSRLERENRERHTHVRTTGDKRNRRLSSQHEGRKSFTPRSTPLQNRTNDIQSTPSSLLASTKSKEHDQQSIRGLFRPTAVSSRKSMSSRASYTPHYSTPLHDVSHESQPTSYSSTKPTPDSQLDPSRCSNAGFMRPTTASSRKSLGGVGKGKSVLKPYGTNPQNATSFLTSRRKSGGFLSKPPQRMTVLQTPQSVSSSFERLSDTPTQSSFYQESEQGQERERISFHTINCKSPYLPLTSPLPVFSPNETDGSLNACDQDDEFQSNSPNSNKSVEDSQALNNLIPIGPTDSCDIENVSDEGNVSVKREAYFSEIDSTENEKFANTTEQFEDELPKLSEALQAFSSLDLSFNFDSSSDDESSLVSTRISRGRSRTLGPILPIPSLRDDIKDDGAKMLPLEAGSENPNNDSLNESIQKNVEFPEKGPQHVEAASVPEIVIDAEEDGNHLPPPRSSRSRSRNFGLLLPIPALRDDLPEEPGSKETICSKCPRPRNEVGDPDTLPHDDDLHQVLEIDDDVDLRSSRRSRDKTRNAGLLLPIPSLRDDLSSNNEESTDSSDPKPSHIEKNKKDASTQYSRASPNLEVYDENSFMKENERSLPDQHSVEINICPSPFEKHTKQRRRRQSLLPRPNLYFHKNSRKLESRRESASPQSANMDDLDDIGTVAPPSLATVRERQVDAADAVEASFDCQSGSNQLDFVPIIKYKERQVLPQVLEEAVDMSAVEALRHQLEQVTKEKLQLEEKLARYNQSYEERVTPYRNIFEEWREQQRIWKATEASNRALVEEVQSKYAMALDLSMKKCQTLQRDLVAAQQKIAELEGASRRRH